MHTVQKTISVNQAWTYKQLAWSAVGAHLINLLEVHNCVFVAQ